MLIETNQLTTMKYKISNNQISKAQQKRIDEVVRQRTSNVVNDLYSDKFSTFTEQERMLLNEALTSLKFNGIPNEEETDLECINEMLRALGDF